MFNRLPIYLHTYIFTFLHLIYLLTHYNIHTCLHTIFYNAFNIHTYNTWFPDCKFFMFVVHLQVSCTTIPSIFLLSYPLFYIIHHRRLLQLAHYMHPSQIIQKLHIETFCVTIMRITLK